MPRHGDSIHPRAARAIITIEIGVAEKIDPDKHRVEGAIPGVTGKVCSVARASHEVKTVTGISFRIPDNLAGEVFASDETNHDRRFSDREIPIATGLDFYPTGPSLYLLAGSRPR